MTITEQLAAAYTKHLLHNPKAIVFENMERAISELPIITAAPNLLAELQRLINDGDLINEAAIKSVKAAIEAAKVKS